MNPLILDRRPPRVRERIAVKACASRLAWLRPLDIAMLCAYLAAAAYITSKLWDYPEGRLLTNEQDQIFFQWVLAHGAQVVADLEYPFITGRMNFPDGVNLMANTSVLGLSIPLAPITLLAGADHAFIVALVAGLAGTAFAWYWVLSRHVVTSPWAAALGGAFCGFAPGMISQAQGHPNLTAQFVVPFIVWRVLRLAETGRFWRNGAILGLLVTYQAFINEEILLFTALACAVFLAAWAVQHPAAARAALPTFARGLGVCALVATSLLAYPLWVQFTGPMHYQGLLHGYQPGADLGSFAAMAQESLLARGIGSPASVHFAEETTFYGWPLLLLLGFIVMWLRKDRMIRALAATALVFAILSIGSPLRVNGFLTSIPGPWGLVNALPIFNAVIPVRLALVIVPLIGVILAIAADRVAAAKPVPPTRLLWSCLLIAALLPIMPTRLTASVQSPVPLFISTGAWKEFVPAGRTLVPVPLPSYPRPEGMRWAAAADLGFAIPGGYFLGPRDGITGNNAQFGAPATPMTKLIDQVVTNKRIVLVDGDDRAAVAEDLRRWNAAVVVLDPTHSQAVRLHRLLTDLLGPGRQERDVWLWQVQP